MAERALRTAASGMYAQQVNIQVIANNIANINTTSFKKSRAEFQDLMYQEVEAHPLDSYLPGVVERTNNKVQVGTGVQLASTQKMHLQGDLQNTGNMMDVAIRGEGFFQIRRQDGTYAFTRDGSFKISADGNLVTSDGYIIEPGLTVPDDAASLAVARDGSVTVTLQNGSSSPLGTIELARFINTGGLNAIGDNLYLETESSGTPILGTPGLEGFGIVEQGFLESSNVDIVEEMVSMITAQRAYEINSKTVSTVEEMMNVANNLKR